MALATVYKDSFKPSTPWMVQIAPCTVLGIKGGKMGSWTSKKQAQAWAANFNKAFPRKGSILSPATGSSSRRG
jgi:hypothetical protein